MPKTPTVRIDPEIADIVRAFAAQETSHEPPHDLSGVVHDALLWYLELHQAVAAIEDLEIGPQPCPMCLNMVAVVPIFTDAGPVCVEKGHLAGCPVRKNRMESVHARRERWNREYPGIWMEQVKNDLAKERRVRTLEDWLDVLHEPHTTDAPQRYQELRKSLAGRLRRQADPPLLEGKLTPEVRRAYARIHAQATKAAKGIKPSQLQSQAGRRVSDKAGAAEMLEFIRGMPKPDNITALEARLVFHEVLQGLLEVFYHDQDDHFPMYEYAWLAIGRRPDPFTEEERATLRQSSWAGNAVCLRG